MVCDYYSCTRYEIQEMRQAQAKLGEAKRQVEEQLAQALAKLAKVQKIGKNQKAKIETMQVRNSTRFPLSLPPSPCYVFR